eukprot:11215971-Alexandrium_andersonii.AAC.1
MPTCFLYGWRPCTLWHRRVRALLMRFVGCHGTAWHDLVRVAWQAILQSHACARNCARGCMCDTLAHAGS